MHATVFVTGLVYLPQQLVMGVAIILLAVASLYICLVRSPLVLSVNWRQQTGWRITTTHNEYQDVILDKSSRYYGMFCALRFVTAYGAHINVLVFRDSVDRTGYRQLLLLLRSGITVSDAADTR
jgi:hypothetical protein